MSSIHNLLINITWQNETRKVIYKILKSPWYQNASVLPKTYPEKILSAAKELAQSIEVLKEQAISVNHTISILEPKKETKETTISQLQDTILKIKNERKEKENELNRFNNLNNNSRDYFLLHYLISEPESTGPIRLLAEHVIKEIELNKKKDTFFILYKCYKILKNAHSFSSCIEETKSFFARSVIPKRLKDELKEKQVLRTNSKLPEDLKPSLEETFSTIEKTKIKIKLLANALSPILNKTCPHLFFQKRDDVLLMEIEQKITKKPLEDVIRAISNLAIPNQHSSKKISLFLLLNPLKSHAILLNLSEKLKELLDIIKLFMSNESGYKDILSIPEPMPEEVKSKIVNMSDLIKERTAEKTEIIRKMQEQHSEQEQSELGEAYFLLDSAIRQILVAEKKYNEFIISPSNIDYTLISEFFNLSGENAPLGRLASHCIDKFNETKNDSHPFSSCYETHQLVIRTKQMFLKSMEWFSRNTVAQRTRDEIRSGNTQLSKTSSIEPRTMTEVYLSPCAEDKGKLFDLLDNLTNKIHFLILNSGDYPKFEDNPAYKILKIKAELELGFQKLENLIAMLKSSY